MKPQLLTLTVLALLGLAGAGTATMANGLYLHLGPFQIHDKSSSGRPDDIVVLGHDVEIPEGSTNHDVVVLLGNARINGRVEGDLTVVLGNVELGPKAELQRPLTLIGANLQQDPEAQVRDPRGTRFLVPAWLQSGVRDWILTGLLWGRPLVHHPGWSWWAAGVMLLFYFFLAVLFPGPVRSTIRTLELQPATSFLAGFLTILVIGPVTLLLVASMVGLVLVPFLLCAFVFSLWLGKVAVYAGLGQKLGQQSGMGFFQQPLPALVIGGVFFFILYMVPILGILIWAMAGTIGLGAVVLAALQALHKETAGTGDAPALVPVSQARAGEPTSEPPPEPLYLPRAGFWLRLGATLLDLILIGAIVSVFRIRSAFPAIWMLYHLGMWWWKGTTFGGIVFGLRIVRLNGQPIGFEVALVRCLSAFFSGVVFFLGFLWVGWNREKQAWHDIIAGTVIVKYPQGTSLI